MVAAGKTFPAAAKVINTFFFHLHTEIYQLHILQFGRLQSWYAKKIPQILRDCK